MGNKKAWSTYENELYRKLHENTALPEYRAPLIIGLFGQDTKEFSADKVHDSVDRLMSDLSDKDAFDVKFKKVKATDKKKKKAVIPVCFLSKLSSQTECCAANYARDNYGVTIIRAYNPECSAYLYEDVPGHLTVNCTIDPNDYIVQNSFMLLAYWDGVVLKAANGRLIDPIDIAVTNALHEDAKTYDSDGEDPTRIKHTIPVYQVIVPSDECRKRDARMAWMSRLLIPYVIESGEDWYTINRAVRYGDAVIGDVEKAALKTKIKGLRVWKISKGKIRKIKDDASRERKAERGKYGFFLNSKEKDKYCKSVTEINDSRDKKIEKAKREAAYYIGVEKYKQDRFKRNASLFKYVDKAVTRGCKNPDRQVEAYDLFEKDANHDICRNNLPAAATHIRHLCLDTIATDLQAKHRYQAIAIAVFAAVGLAGYGVFSDIASPFSILGVIGAITSSVCIAFAVVLFLLNIWKKNRDNYLNLRLLAESLRTKTFLNAAGLTDSCVADYFNERQKINIEWALLMLRAWDVLDHAYGYYNGDIIAADVSSVQEMWIGTADDMADLDNETGRYQPTCDGQLAYYRKRSNVFFKEDRKLARHKTWTTISVVLITFIVAGVAIYKFAIDPHVSLAEAMKTPFVEIVTAGDAASLFESIMIFVAGILPAALACWLMYKETRMYAENAQRYKWMAIKYQKFIDCLNKAENREEKLDILEKVGIAAAEEIGEWTILTADSDINLPF